MATSDADASPFARRRNRHATDDVAKKPKSRVPGSGTAVTGGAYPNDDVTQTPLSNITIDLGQQDASTNGLYTGVTVTVPDTYSACATTSFGGTDANGNPTCIFHGDAIVGQPNGKYVVFVTVNDVSLAISHYTADAALDFFLYQQ